METQPLRTGLQLTRLGQGLSQLGNLGTAVSDADASAVVETAWEGGIRYFDTAPFYGLGLSEHRGGALLRQHPRDEYVLSTKVGRLLVPDPDGASRRDDAGFDVPADHRRVWDFSRDGIRRSIEDSLVRLGHDRIDIAYVHDPDDFVDDAARHALPALVELREQGVLNAIGVGMNDATKLAELVRRCDVDVVMCANRYTLLEQPAAAELLPLTLERGVGVVIAGVFNSGLLAAPRPRADAQYDYAPAPSELVARVNRIADVCEAHGVTLPAAALAFPALHPAVVSVVVGCRNGAQVRSALDNSRAEISQELWQDLAEQGLLAPELVPEQGELREAL